VAAYRYRERPITRGDRVRFETTGYKRGKVFSAIILGLYKFGETDTRLWKALVDDGLGRNLRVVTYNRLRLEA
jgi:hypothetical protein